MQYEVWRAGGKSEYRQRGGTWYTFSEDTALLFLKYHQASNIMSYVNKYTITVNNPYIVKENNLGEAGESFLAYYYVRTGEEQNCLSTRYYYAQGKKLAIVSYMRNMQGIRGNYEALEDIVDAEGRWEDAYEYIEYSLSKKLKKLGYDSILFVDCETDKPLNLFLFDK